MKGIWMLGGTNLRTDGECDLRYLFKPIFPVLEKLVFLRNEAAFYLPDEWEDESEWDSEREEYVSGPMKEIGDRQRPVPRHSKNKGAFWTYCDPGFLTDYCDHIRTFDVQYLGFEPPFELTDAEHWAKSYETTPSLTTRLLNKPKARRMWADREELFRSTVKVAIGDRDAAMWEVHSPDEALINAVERHLTSLEVKHQEVSFAASACF